MDFSGLLSVIDVSSVVLVIMAIAAIKILPEVTRWGTSMVINWFR